MTERDNSTPLLCNIIFRNIVITLNVKPSGISKVCEDNGRVELEERCQKICGLYKERFSENEEVEISKTKNSRRHNNSELRLIKLHEALCQSRMLSDAINASNVLLEYLESFHGRIPTLKMIEEVKEVEDSSLPSGFSLETIKKILKNDQTLKEYQINIFLRLFLNPYFLKHYLVYEDCREYVLDMDQFLYYDKKTKERVYYPNDRQKAYLSKMYDDYKNASYTNKDDLIDDEDAINTFTDFLTSIFNFFLNANIKGDSIEEKENVKRKLQTICENTKEHKLACTLAETEMTGTTSPKDLLENAIYKGVRSFEAAKKSSLVLGRMFNSQVLFSWIDAEKSSGYLTYLHWLYYSSMGDNLIIGYDIAEKFAKEVYKQYKTYISPFSIISDRSFIQQNCIIHDNARIEENVFLSGVVVEKNAVVKAGSILCGNSIIVKENCIISPNTIIINKPPLENISFDFQSNSLDDSGNCINYIELGYGVDNEKE